MTCWIHRLGAGFAIGLRLSVVHSVKVTLFAGLEGIARNPDVRQNPNSNDLGSCPYRVSCYLWFRSCVPSSAKSSRFRLHYAYFALLRAFFFCSFINIKNIRIGDISCLLHHFCYRPQETPRAKAPKVGWIQEGESSTACYYPPNFAVLDIERKEAQSEAFDAVIAQWGGEKGAFAKFRFG